MTCSTLVAFAVVVLASTDGGAFHTQRWTEKRERAEFEARRHARARSPERPHSIRRQTFSLVARCELQPERGRVYISRIVSPREKQYLEAQGLLNSLERPDGAEGVLYEDRLFVWVNADPTAELDACLQAEDDYELEFEVRSNGMKLTTAREQTPLDTKLRR